MAGSRGAGDGDVPTIVASADMLGKPGPSAYTIQVGRSRSKEH